MIVVRFLFILLFVSNIAFSKSAQLVLAGTKIGKVPQSFCEDKTFATFKLFITGSDFISLYFQKTKNSTHLIFDDVSLEFPQDEKFIAGLCAQKSLNIKPEMLSVFLTRIKKSLPFCAVRVVKDRGLVCDPKKAKTIVEKKLNRNLIGLKRQSYRVSRRVILSQQIINADMSSKEARESVCRQIRSSDPIELPIVLHSKSNQDLFCNKNSYLRPYFLNVVELEANLLVRFIKENTHLGVIKLVGPIQRQDYLVAVASDRMFEFKATLPKNKIAMGCQLPFLKPSAEQVEYLKSIGLFHGNCKHERASSAAQNDAHKILWGLAASDGEFEVSINRGKYIRLPLGQVRLSIEKAQKLGKSPLDLPKIRKELLWSAKKKVFKVKL